MFRKYIKLREKIKSRLKIMPILVELKNKKIEKSRVKLTGMEDGH